ncbi:MAG: hypothetical protein M1822_007394 [Bathelium mastoideum]|nr:MAG: hypothetical protein M1822_007394 [Bathelium mastoideum]
MLRHVETPRDIVDYLEELLQGRFWLVGRTKSTDTPHEELPYSLRAILRSFTIAVKDADADSPQLNTFRQSMAQLIATIGDSQFLESSSSRSEDGADGILDPSEYEQERFLHRLLGDPHKHPPEDGCSDFDTFSARATVIALAAAANGVNMIVRCVTASGKKETLFKAKDSIKGVGHVFTFTLWLVPPPTAVAEMLRQVNTREDFESRKPISGPLPILGGIVEVSRIVAKQIDCQHTAEEVVALWTKAVEIGSGCTWEADFAPHRDHNSLRCKISDSWFLSNASVPADLTDLANAYFQAPRSDPRHLLARKAGSILHATLGYSNYDSFPLDRFRKTMDFILVALFTGCIGALASNAQDRLSFYGWTGRTTELLGNAESIVYPGLPLNTIILTVARMWGG